MKLFNAIVAAVGCVTFTVASIVRQDLSMLTVALLMGVIVKLYVIEHKIENRTGK